MKKLISAVLTAVMTASVLVIPPSVAVRADSSSWNDDDIMPLLDSLGIMEGDGNGNYFLDSYVSREEMAKIAVNSSPFKDETAVGIRISPFKDVEASRWSSAYILNGTQNGLFNGYLDGTFKPLDMVKYEEAVTMMLKVLGYSDDYFGVSYPYGQVNMANNIDLTDNVNSDYSQWLTRRQVARMVYNALNAELKSNITKTSSSSSGNSQSTSSSQNMPSSQGTSLQGTSSSQGTTSSQTSTTVFASAGSKLISVFDAQIVEDAIIIATPNEDSSLGSDKVFTSSGKYTMFDGFNTDYVGMQGDMVIQNGKDLLCFVPDRSEGAGETDKYVIYSLLSNAVIGYKNGAMEQIDLSDSTTCYKGTSTYTYSTIKTQMEMGDILRVKYSSGGDVDYIVYEEGNMEGPTKVTSADMINSYIKDSATQVMRDGNKVTSADIQLNDVIYYSSDLNMVLAYSTKVTGIYESASPSRDQPNSITISGKSYDVESVQAFNDLSSSGPFKYGDTITVILGKDGDVAGVVTNTETATTTKYGFVVSTGKKNFTNNDGTTYSSYYVDIIAADGNSYEYAVPNNCSSYINTVVKASFDNGETKITGVSTSSSGGISGVVDSDALTIGSHKIASDCKILDTVGYYDTDAPLYKSVYLQRLDGINISSGKVRYYAKNARDEITELILWDVTGDCYTYGLVTGGSNETQYTVDVDGTSYTTTFSSGVHIYKPCKGYIGTAGLELKGTLDSYNGNISTLTAQSAKIGNVEYLLSDKVVVYMTKDNSTFNTISINEAINGDYTMTAYYDKKESEGGRIRVIVAVPKK